LVYCVKCGTKNEEDAKVCNKCGASLYAVGEGEHYRRVESECFGIPRGNLVVGIFFGLIIIFLGISTLLNQVYNINLPWWPVVIILFGLLIIAGAVYRMRRRY
jgi:uncharacterized membrane protein YvbJ